VTALRTGPTCAPTSSPTKATTAAGALTGTATANRKETDLDNDNYWNTGSSAGCEDINRNGFFNGPDETSNFDPARDCRRPGQ